MGCSIAPRDDSRGDFSLIFLTFREPELFIKNADTFYNYGNIKKLS